MQDVEEPNGKTRTKVAVIEDRLSSFEKGLSRIEGKVDLLVQVIPRLDEQMKSNEREHKRIEDSVKEQGGEAEKQIVAVEGRWDKWRGQATAAFFGVVLLLTGGLATHVFSATAVAK